VTDLAHTVTKGCLVLKPSRRIDSASAKAFEDGAASILATSPQKVVVDASDLDYISSAGLRVILTTAKKAKAAGGALTFAAAHGNVREVLVVSGFDSIFGLHDDVASAIAALG